MRAAAVAGFVLALAAPAVLACGYCVEDKVASAYDHAVITKALAQKHQVAFFHIDGPVTTDAATKHSIEAIVKSTAGIDKGSVRVAVETYTVSFAFDPARTPLVALQSTLDRKLRAKRLALMPLQVIDAPAVLRTVSR